MIFQTSREVHSDGTTATVLRGRRPSRVVLQRAPATPAGGRLRPSQIPVVPDPGAVLQDLGSGEALDHDVPSRMEPLFARDLSDVRVHIDGTAASLAARLDARAFTVGRHVALGSGQYRPGTTAGDALLAHELAHVVQQAGPGSAPPRLEDGSPEYDALEREADATASLVGRLSGGGRTDVAGGVPSSGGRRRRVAAAAGGARRPTRSRASRPQRFGAGEAQPA